MRRYRAAVRERNLQVEAHRGLTATLPDGLAQTWEAMCVVWESAPHPKKEVENPYHTEGLCKCSEERIKAEAYRVLSHRHE